MMATTMTTMMTSSRTAITDGRTTAYKWK